MTTTSGLNIFKLLRIVNQKKVKDIASELYVSTSYVYAIEHNFKFPAKDLLEHYAKVLNTTTDILIKFKSKENENKLDDFIINKLNASTKEDVIKLYVVPNDLIYKAKVCFYPIERHYESEGEAPYIKYLCPICNIANIKMQVQPFNKNCPICGVSLKWKEIN